ncbi:MAG: hypothetical protein CMC55_06535 [Flavobacteriaceae bacterium]|mgnify:FL=1|nr:hypothetical protein [Flavobacteriaceae bacterium]|tara:strand:- start:59 stop:670 length:612 start_codon:yes stop_codon:yes gene_type:complete
MSQRRLTNLELDMANLNTIAYKMEEQRTSYKEYVYQSFLSDGEVAVFKKDENKTIYIIYKGTNNYYNLKTDMRLFLNRMDKTFHIANEKFEKVRKTFPNYKMFVSGHSLGGTKSLYVSQKCNDCVKGVVFNSYIPTLKLKLVNLINNTNDVTKFVNSADILSRLAIIINKNKVVIMVSKGYFNTMLDFHTLKQYVDEDYYLTF